MRAHRLLTLWVHSSGLRALTKIVTSRQYVPLRGAKSRLTYVILICALPPKAHKFQLVMEKHQKLAQCLLI
jgi:hypothetical protein